MKKEFKCSLCGNALNFHYRAMQEWNIEGDICGQCYSKKLTEYYISEDRRGITKK